MIIGGQLPSLNSSGIQRCAYEMASIKGGFHSRLKTRGFGW
jgi:hypothetical protein